MPTYQDTIDYLFAQLPMFQRIGKKAFKKDLSNINALTTYLGKPHTLYPTIHIAGTNGKGSTAHGIASILQEAGYKVGLYTSPHYKDFRERIKINGTFISEEAIINFVEAHKDFFENKVQPSFFEITVAMAFDYFAKEAVDYAVIETGLGGIYDSTNIITPILSVITNISFDHMHILGNTLPKIASSKAGIIKPNVPVVIGKYQPEVMPVFLEKANECNSRLFVADQKQAILPKSDLVGPYQHENIATILKAADILQLEGLPISDQNILAGLENVIANTRMMGRWQTLQKEPLVITDSAHNIAGFQHVVDKIRAMDYRQLHIVFGVVKDKDVEALLELLPKNAYYYLCCPNLPRGLNAQLLQEKMQPFGFETQVFDSVEQALNIAIETAHKEDFIYVGGSTFVVAEVI